MFVAHVGLELFDARVVNIEMLVKAFPLQSRPYAAQNSKGACIERKKKKLSFKIHIPQFEIVKTFQDVVVRA